MKHVNLRKEIPMKFLYSVFFVLVLVLVYIFPAVGFFWLRGGISFLDGLNFSELAYALFPLLGLYAFSMLWLQFVMGSARDVLTKVFPKVLKFHINQGPFVLLFALLHPIALMIGVGLDSYLSMFYIPDEMKRYVYLGIVALLFMILAVAAAVFRKSSWLQKRWLYIHYLNYLVFVFAWLHSRNLGTDTQVAPFKELWLFYGVTAIVAILLRLRRMIVERKRLAVLAS